MFSLRPPGEGRDRPSWIARADGDLHLVPVDCNFQMRPSLQYLDEADKQAKMEAAAAAADSDEDLSDSEDKPKEVQVTIKRRESERATAARKKSHAYLQKQVDDEDWVDLKFYNSSVRVFLPPAPPLSSSSLLVVLYPSDARPRGLSCWGPCRLRLAHALTHARTDTRAYAEPPNQPPLPADVCRAVGPCAEGRANGVLPVECGQAARPDADQETCPGDLEERCASLPRLPCGALPCIFFPPPPGPHGLLTFMWWVAGGRCGAMQLKLCISSS